MVFLRMAGALLLSALLFTSTAAAQTFSSRSGPVLSPDNNIDWMSQSIGGPSVAYDPQRDRFLMVFESWTPNVHPDCPQGVWALGLAESSDGVSWTVDPTPIILPIPGSGSYYSCVAAHPAVVYDGRGNGSLYVLFKAEEDRTSCETSPYPVCPYTGIGGARVRFEPSGAVRSIDVVPDPVLALDGPGGHPSFVVQNGRFAMMYQRYPSVYRTQSNTLRSFPPGTLTFDAAAPWGDSGIEWIYDEFKSPSLLCDDSRNHPFAAWVGSVDTNFGTVQSGSWGKSISRNGSRWDLPNFATTAWIDNDDWRHWDMLRLVSGDYLVWYSSKNAQGTSEIYFGGTTLSFENEDVQSRVCD